jgi:hypothetical protein
MTFEFDSEKSFDENIAMFRAFVEQIDPECAAIFFEKLDVLVGDGDPDRARARRGDFNAAVISALEQLPARDDGAA